MKKLSIKDIVSFKNKSEKAKQNFAINMKIDKGKIESVGGGDYWVTCLSAISNSYKLINVQSVIDKKNELYSKLETAENTKTKNMYERNIKILANYENCDFTKFMPPSKLNFLRKKKDDYILVIKEIPIQVKPHFVFSFDNNGIEEVGSVWFIAKLNGFKKDELGMFTDILHRYLKTHFSEQYNINSRYVIAIDVFNSIEVNYSQLENNEILKILDSTIKVIKAMM